MDGNYYRHELLRPRREALFGRRSQIAVAAKVGVTRVHLDLIERGKSASIEALRKYAVDLLGFQMHEIIRNLIPDSMNSS